MTEETIRKKVTVTKVFDPKPMSRGGNVYNFMAIDGDSKELRYGLFSDELAACLIMDDEIDIEYTEKISEDEQFINRSVRQIYKEGKPVRTKQASGKKIYGDSPEKILSIERQNTSTNLTQLRTSGVEMTKAEQLAWQKALAFMSSRYDEKPSVQKLEQETPKVIENDTKVVSKPSDDWRELESESKDKATEAQRKKIIADSGKMGYTSKDVIQIMNKAWGITSTKDLSKKQASALIQFIASGKTANEVEELKGVV